MNKTYSTARINKDKSWDGTFFFGVKTTGIFCRPSCPAPVAKEENVVYFDTLYSALKADFTPCWRCRPDIVLDHSGSNIQGAKVVREALGLIAEGWLNTHSTAELADKLHFSERHMRKLFTDHLGISPKQAAINQRAIFAKKLILGSQQNFTEIAFAAGFQSLRQFNETIKKHFGKSPREIRKMGHIPAAGAEEERPLFLPSRTPVHFTEMLNFFREKAIPGVERVEKNSYQRTFREETGTGHFVVRNSRRQGLELTIHSEDVGCYMKIHNRVRRMFSLDVDMERIEERLVEEDFLFAQGAPHVVPRLPVAYDPFELVVRTVIEEDVSPEEGTAFMGAIVQQAGLRAAQEGEFYFPLPEELLQLDLAATGLSKVKQQTLVAVAEAIAEDRLHLTPYQNFDEFSVSFLPVQGIDKRCVDAVAMFGLGMQDCFPLHDPAIIRACAEDGGSPRTRQEMLDLAERWRPWRSFAALCSAWKML